MKDQKFGTAQMTARCASAKRRELDRLAPLNFGVHMDGEKLGAALEERAEILAQAAALYRAAAVAARGGL